MPVIVVLAKDDFPILASHGIAELITIATLLKNGSGNTEIRHRSGDRVTGEEIRHFFPAESKKPAVWNYRYGSEGSQMRSAKQSEAFVFIEREQAPGPVAGKELVGIT